MEATESADYRSQHFYSENYTEQIRTGNGYCDKDYSDEVSLEGGKGGVLDVKSLYVLPNGASCRPAAHRSLMRVVVNQSSLHRSASSALASTSRDFPDGWRWPRTRFIGFVRGAQICMVCVHHWRQVKGIWLVVAATTVWSSLTGLCNASCSATGLPARAFCHHTCSAYRW